MGAQFSQFFPPSPTFTENEVGSQKGKVFLITGGYSGIGFELAKILYQKGGRVYIAGRSPDKARQAIEQIQTSSSGEGGSLYFLALELDDLSTIKKSAEKFKAKESKLDVLWNNAGVSQPPLGSQSKQGFELQLATNCLGPFLFTQLLLPMLIKAAEQKNSDVATGRVVWLSSQIMELSAPKGGVLIADLKDTPKNQTRNYVTSKTVNYFLSCEFARREGPANGVISVSINPGAANTQLFRHTPMLRYLAWPLLYKPVFAAYTELYAGFSPDVTLAKNGSYILPWGRISTAVREDLALAAHPKEDGGDGRAAEVWEFCEEATKKFA